MPAGCAGCAGAGLFVLKLVRDDYDEETIPTFDESNIAELRNLRQSTFGELVNSVSVEYQNWWSREKASVSAQDTALTISQNAVINASASYPGFTEGELASRIALRDLKALSTPVWSCTAVLNKEGGTLTPGDVISMSWGVSGLSAIPMRVRGISFGNGTDNRVKVELIQDVFGLPAEGGSSSPGSDDGWSPIDTAAQPPEAVFSQECPYYPASRFFVQSVLDGTLSANPDAGYVLAAGSRPDTGSALYMKLNVDSGSGYTEFGTVDFSPRAVTTDVLLKTGTTVGITNLVDSDLITVGQLAQIGSEIVRVDAVSANSLTLGRGMLDTIPLDHLSGLAVSFWDTYAASDEIERTATDSVTVKLTTVTTSSSLDIDDAPAGGVTFNSRAIRPYPPGNFQINSEYWPDLLPDSSQFITVTWAHRDRKIVSILNDFLDGNVGPESGTTYELDFYNEDGVLSKQVTGVTGTTYTWTTEGADSGLPDNRLNENVRVVLRSRRDGYASLNEYDHTINREGYGFFYGEAYGE